MNKFLIVTQVKFLSRQTRKHFSKRKRAVPMCSCKLVTSVLGKCLTYSLLNLQHVTQYMQEHTFTRTSEHTKGNWAHVPGMVGYPSNTKGFGHSSPVHNLLQCCISGTPYLQTWGGRETHDNQNYGLPHHSCLEATVILTSTNLKGFVEVHFPPWSSRSE